MSAVISECGRYRYVLTRELAPPGPFKATITWVMLNPSTADANTDDPTIRKCLGFSKRLGWLRMHVVNLFAFRSTDPRVLSMMSDSEAIGPENDDWLRGIANRSTVIVCAWGAAVDDDERYGRGRVAAAVEALRDGSPSSRDFFCLGTTKSGQPKHPLYVPYDQPLVPWSPR